MAKIIAEISGNHGGNLDEAVKLITAAADAGCDYAKFQYYQAADMPWTGPDDYEMYSKLAVPPHWLPGLFETAKDLGIGLFASVFSGRAARELLAYDMPYIKIACTRSTNLGPLIYRDIASVIPQDLTTIVSVALPDVTMDTIFPDALLMVCPPGHPPTPEAIVAYLRNVRDGQFALSDHTSTLRLPVTAMEFGATLIEKHFKINETCVDAKFSADFKTMRQLCRIAH